MTAVLEIGAGVLMLGLLALLGCFLWMLWNEEGSLATAIAAMIGLPLICGFGYAIFGAIGDRDSPILAELHKGEWACTSAHIQVITTYVSTGKVMVPVVSSYKVCDAYARSSS
jgi:hypothetical protein